MLSPSLLLGQADSVKITFHGAVRTTTGSQHLLEINGVRLLLDCGLYQGKRKESIERNQSFPFNPNEVDAVILSHAHIDHIGNLPNLYKQGFTGNAYCTFATRDLAAIMLEDSAEIQMADAAYVSKKHKKKGMPPVEPLYTPEDAECALRQFVSLGYDRPLPVANGVTLSFRDAGHILGSAQVILDIDEGGEKRRLLFSGDIGRGDHAILRNPQPVEDVDVLLVESTYGNREHTAQSGLTDEIEALLSDTLNNGGKVIIPAFSVGRTQLLVYTLHQLVEAGRLPAFPIYVDSPLSVNATEVFRLHPECFNRDIYTFLREKKNPFGMDNLTYIRKASESIKLNSLDGPAIIISSSGMCEAGRIRHHLKNNISDPNDLILFVGYCAYNTLGSVIRAGIDPVYIFGEAHEVKAKIASFDGFSGHADKNELVDYVKSLTGDIKKIFVVHGEERSSLAFADTLRQIKPGAEVTVPELNESFEA
ncbi:MAG TPA: MBL fold metallo-hydrolase [Verrucomicrobiota bacterium]|nr:MBL fold metallo-hydrolase [Verrucomicrobiota bacterium]